MELKVDKISVCIIAMLIVICGFVAKGVEVCAKEDVPSYGSYLENYEDVQTGSYNEEMVAYPKKWSGVTAHETYNGKNDVFEFQGDMDSYVEYEVNIENAGLYQVSVDYALVESSVRNVYIGIMMDGAYLFKESQEIYLPMVCVDDGTIRVDSTGNEITPKQINVLDWQNHTLMDTSGLFEGNYEFYLEKGKHIIRLNGNDSMVKIGGITLSNHESIISYEDYLKNISSGAKDTKGVLIKIQGENAKEKSTTVLYPTYDRINYSVEDSKGQLNDPKFIKINTIGGSSWSTSGQWISWEVDVPESGFYELGCKFRQNYLDGSFVSRTLFVDGKILYDDFTSLKFPYDDEWQVITFSDVKGEPLKVYLNEGIHEIKMMCTMGEYADILKNVNECLSKINDIYRQIVMVTGSNPDAYTDYFLEDRVPALREGLEECRDILNREIEYNLQLTGDKGIKNQILETLRIQIDTFLEDIDEIPKGLNSFKNNISAVGAWLINIQTQGLQLDYIFVKSSDVKAPDVDTSWLKNMVYSVKRFIASFDESTNNIGESSNDAVTVWLSGAGRDQAQVLKDMIDESFTSETGISVNLQLVQGSLIEATLAGTGPDVALMVGEEQPVNFAIRGALQDLTVFEDYEEIIGRFYESAVEPFWYEDGLYAIPDTQTFNMLFYRTDVFEDLGITVPKTWDEFYDILPIIQRNNLQMTVQDVFPTLLFQNGGAYYSEDGKQSLLDSQIAVDAMTTYTDLYVKYGFEIKTDFYSRFRSGELVVSIQPYNMYNQLMVSAPEIKGLWEMAPIPGVIKEDGSINTAQNSSVSGTIMLKGCENKEAAWEFMKWWSRDDIKAKYGITLEGIMGPSARFTPANIGTLEMLPWPSTQLVKLEEAWKNVRGIPQLPGSYYTARGITNAFRSIVYNGDTPRYAMNIQTGYINEEITRKRIEFGLDAVTE